MQYAENAEKLDSAAKGRAVQHANSEDGKKSSAAHPLRTRDATSRAAGAARRLRRRRRRRPYGGVHRRRYVRLKRTNLRVIGLSLNRSQKRSALLSTTPRLRTRSSTNDLAPLRRMWLLSLRHTGAFVGARQEPSCCGFATAGAEIGRPAYIVASRRKRR